MFAAKDNIPYYLPSESKRNYFGWVATIGFRRAEPAGCREREKGDILNPVRHRYFGTIIAPAASVGKTRGERHGDGEYGVRAIRGQGGIGD